MKRSSKDKEGSSNTKGGASSKKTKDTTATPPTTSISSKDMKSISNSSSSLRRFVPLPLVIIIFICSGSLWMLALRDLFRTGQVIFGSMDKTMLQFTHSTQWYDSSQGWKSTQGGFSAIQPKTTDANNMGGFFVRKLTGAASLIVHSQKLFPVLLPSDTLSWSYGHYDPMFLTAIVGNLSLVLFYLTYQKVLVQANASALSLYIILVSFIEALCIFVFLIHRWLTKKKQQYPKQEDITTYPSGKNSTSLVSNIVARTVGIVTVIMLLIASRDLFFPGYDMGFPPMDDIYLEWTGAFIHSPPYGSIEESTHGLEAPLHVGDLFISQLGALYLVIFCFQKIVAAFMIRYGKDGQGGKKCILFWRIQCIGDVFLLIVFRAFATCAKSASFDVRWHLMCLGYEACILALYGYF